MFGEDETTQLRGISLIRPMFYSTTDHNELRIAIGLQASSGQQVCCFPLIDFCTCFRPRPIPGMTVRDLRMHLITAKGNFICQKNILFHLLLMIILMRELDNISYILRNVVGVGSSHKNFSQKIRIIVFLKK